MKIVLIFVGIVFAVFGFSEFLHILKLGLVFPNPKLYSHIVVNLQNETAEKQILYVWEQYLWHRNSYADFIIFNASALDEENYSRAKEIAEKYGIKLTGRI